MPISSSLTRLRELPEEARQQPRKQRYTVKRMWEFLCKKGFTGGYTTVKDVVRQLRRQAPKEGFQAAKFPTLKTIESFRFDAQPGINEALVRELLTGEFIDRRENVLLFEMVSRAYERQSLVVTTNLPFQQWQWPEVCGSERLTETMLDRLTHRVHVVEANGESCRLGASRRRPKCQRKARETVPAG